ncbi:MAG: dihydrodipicolinate synthase family protein, partial [Candidatus Omnitrophica bacterium]|nr:dihydrodipicolinate synthase family protein [Candidatus Omnitrophota bacterium]
SVTANIVPGRVSQMVHHALNGRWNEALKVHRELYKINRLLFVETNPIPVKTALGMMGKIRPELRLPLCEMSKDNETKLRDALKNLGVIS